jgi:aerobic carbon-monoxide dehydrogenase medium subunit
MGLRYAAPASLSEALAFLADHGRDSSILAGGMSVVPALKQGLLAGKVIVNIKGMGKSPASVLEVTNDRLMIGALVCHREIESSSLVAKHIPALCALEQLLASVQIRNHGTLGGSLCAAEPWSDPPCLLAALDARLLLAAKRGEREASAAEWVVGVGKTLRQPDELLLRIDVPLPRGSVGVGHARLAARQGLARPLACAAARIALSENGSVSVARVFVGAVGPRPQRMADVEAMLVGRPANGERSTEIEHAVARAVEYLPDERCSASYKRQVAGVLVRRVIAAAAADAKRRGGGA